VLGLHGLGDDVLYMKDSGQSERTANPEKGFEAKYHLRCHDYLFLSVAESIASRTSWELVVGEISGIWSALG
jgi:hypothetical protein